MRTDVARDLSDSAYDFLRVVWPAVGPRLQAGRIEPVESVSSEGLKHDLDVLAGIDAWQMLDDKGLMRGIASRIQWGPESWHTFTVRKERPNGAKTELEKRITAFMEEAGWLIPAITIQAYVTKPRRGGQLIQAGLAYSKDLYSYAVKHPCIKPRTNPEDGVKFDWFDWFDMRRAGHRVEIINGMAAAVVVDEEPPDQDEWADAITRRPPDDHRWRP